MVSIGAATVIVGFALFLIGLTVLVFAAPALAGRFFMSLAQSARAHYTEQAFRLLIGAALVVRAPSMRHPAVFAVLGWAIVVSSAALMLVPWQWHRRMGDRVLPMLIRHMGLYAVGIAAFAVLLLYGVLSGPGGAG